MRVPPAGTWALRPSWTEMGTPLRGSQALGHIVLLLLVITPQWRWIPSKTPNVAPRSSQRCNPGGYLRGGVSLCASHSRPAALPNLGRLQKKLLQTRCKGRRLCPNAGAQPRGHSACVMFWGGGVGVGGRGASGRKTGRTSAMKDPPVLKCKLRVTDDLH
ncbi:PREDICTED: putative uncharacterized protein C18orf65 homolog [Cercocebus atys]|uniref:putative uncharacterized protein C18orf65 homolog n=1 Tax=Cercocebus atys TaxID=9531 RepID=UPI0005F51371|nr:PREDICTED: putative uncharacterized protein C18orf65 homolog [Cercocebus atys]